MILPSELPADVRRRVVQPPGLPDGDVAWSRDDALVALEALEGSVVAVLQVDIYAIPFGQHEVIHTGRQATFVHHVGELANDFAVRSRRQAAELISAAAADELFVLYFSGQDDAAAGYGESTAAAS
jgi:hypothetical protein